MAVPDLRAAPGPQIPPALAAGLRSIVAVPLMVDEKVMGAMIVARREANGFSSDDATFLRALAEHVSLAAHHAQLYHSLQEAYDELRQTQQAVMQQERLRALGQMASGIAHDINNAISPAMLYAKMLLLDPSLSPEARERVKAIVAACEDVVHMVARMRDFYRPRTEQEVLTPVNLNRVVEQVADLTRPRWRDIPLEQGATITLEMDLDPDLPDLPAVEPQIREALVNLIFNAVEAMPDGGTLTLRTRYLPGTEGRPEGCILVEVADTGIGMDEETRQRCLEPFFTTKPGGSGLGLAMVYGIVHRHDGEIEIESEPGRGTTVRLILPMRPLEEPLAEAEEGAAPPSLRILFIDDEPLIRHSLKETLEREGHAVEVADGGEAGLAAFRAAQERGEPFDVVITDLGMPYVDGREVARTVKRESPETPVLLLSGWGIVLDEERIPPQVDAVLSKPPRASELRRVLARLARGG